MVVVKFPFYILWDVKTVLEKPLSLNVPLRSFTSLPTGGEIQKASNHCQPCELIQDCSDMGAFFFSLHSGDRFDAPSVDDGYFASAPCPSSVSGEVANGGRAYGLVTRSLSETNSLRERGVVL